MYVLPSEQRKGNSSKALHRLSTTALLKYGLLITNFNEIVDMLASHFSVVSSDSNYCEDLCALNEK